VESVLFAVTSMKVGVVSSSVHHSASTEGQQLMMCFSVVIFLQTLSWRRSVAHFALPLCTVGF
jgi:hypothetical protein